MHHEDILRYNDNSHAHDHYDFFRACLAGESYGTELKANLDFLLETVMNVFAEIVEVPVLLSMLAVVLGNQDTSSGKLQLPKDVYQLYRLAVNTVISIKRGALASEDVLNCLRRIAYRNHLLKQRTFTSEDVREALGDEPELLDVWRRLTDSSAAPPLIKVLASASASGARGEYQFGHLSFQEFLFVEMFEQYSGGALPPGFSGTGKEKARFIKDKFYAHAIDIGGARLSV